MSDDVVAPENAVEAVICIPTFRRPDGVASTLHSLLAQRGTTKFAIVVVENDGARPVGADAASKVLAETQIPHAVVIEHRQGNVHAINRAFLEARERFPSARYLLMIDDDEIATEDWLSKIVSTAKEKGADIVGGPVVRRFEVPVGLQVSSHPLYGFISGPTRQVPVIHGTGNCLIRREVFSSLDNGLFDEAFNFLGGGDMEFFARCRAAGCTFWWCEEAVIHETVAAERVSAAWLMRRSIRTGSINYVIDRKRSPSLSGLAKLQAKNVVSLGLSLFRAIGLLATTKKVLPATHPILMSIGRITGSLGFLPAPYEASQIASSDRKPDMPAQGRASER